jgi:hypothetical protein
MVKKIVFKNNLEENLEVLIEPAAEFINIGSGSEITIELDRFTDKYDDELAMVLENGTLIIYESRQCKMKIFQNDEQCTILHIMADNFPADRQPL